MKLAPELDFTQCRPVKLPDGTWSGIKDHVKIGVRALLANEYFFLTDEMGGMKSAQCIIAAQFLFERHIIDRVITVAPASVFRDVWFDEELGELRRHLFIPTKVFLYHGKWQGWRFDPLYCETPEGWAPPLSKRPTEQLNWINANYEYIRLAGRLDGLLEYADSRTLLIIDESSAVRNYRTKQTDACMTLRWAYHGKGAWEPRCGRIVELNGTPIANSPMDLFSQGNLLHPDIHGCRYITHFRAHYANMVPVIGPGGKVVKDTRGRNVEKIESWKNIDQIQKQFAPYVLRRLKRDCLDLPPVLPEVTLTAELTKDTWVIYRDMRDELVAWLSNSTVSMATHTITKVLRLSQITSGFIGGIEPEVYDRMQFDRPGFLDELDAPPNPTEKIREIGREKLDVVLERLEAFLEADDTLKLLTWCRFVPEVKRLLLEVKEKFPHMAVGAVAGQSILGLTKDKERHEAVRLLDPRTAPPGPVFVGGTYGTGSLGLNFTACHTVINCSFDESYWKKEQGDARVDRPGQVHPVSPFNIVAVGPKGQKTIDHKIVLARQGKEDLATWTTSAWIKALTEE